MKAKKYRRKYIFNISSLLFSIHSITLVFDMFLKHIYVYAYIIVDACLFFPHTNEIAL